MSLIINLSLTQKNPLKIFLIYFAEDSSDSTDIVQLIHGTKAILDSHNSLIALEYKIVASSDYFDLVGQFDVPENSHITKTAYLRYFLDIFVDEDTDKLLYLDIDVLVKKDIGELFELEFDEVIAASLASPKSMAIGEHLSNFNSDYFNSGVLIINMVKWREQQIGDELARVTIGKTFPYLDQDALNLVFKNRWKRIDRRYNWFHDATKRQIEIKEWPEPSIIHFVGLKPWQLCDETEYVIEYRTYFERIRALPRNLLNRE